MDLKNKKNLLMFEISLIVIIIGLDWLLYQIVGYQMIVLNLFFLPIILAAFYLGRYRAGVLAFFCMISVSVITAMRLSEFAALSSPLVIGLAVALWGAVLGLTALLVGTLSDERMKTLLDLHEAHLGVVEVLSQYLQCANPKLQARSTRVAEISQTVASRMKLSQREIDNIRVASLLYDLENVEITAKVIRKAVGDLGSKEDANQQQTVHGTELARSLSSALSGAFPLLVSQGDDLVVGLQMDQTGIVPMGGQIIRTVRAYDNLIHGDWGNSAISPKAAVDELRQDVDAEHHPAVLDILGKLAEADRPEPKKAAKPPEKELVSADAGS